MILLNEYYDAKLCTCFEKEDLPRQKWKYKRREHMTYEQNLQIQKNLFYQIVTNFEE